MSRTLVRLSLALSLSALGMTTASAEVYTWTDAEGRMHFSDRQPQGEAETVQMPEATESGPADMPEERLEKQRKLLHAFEEERRQKRDAEEQARRETAERQRNCVEARDGLQNHERASGVYRLGPDGQRVFLSDEEREQSLAQMRAAVEQWCGEL